MKTQCNDYVGMDAPVTHDVSGHRTLKKQQNSDIWVSMNLFKEALQMNLSYINQFTGLTDKVIKVGAHKTRPFV